MFLKFKHKMKTKSLMKPYNSAMLCYWEGGDKEGVEGGGGGCCHHFEHLCGVGPASSAATDKHFWEKATCSVIYGYVKIIQYEGNANKARVECVEQITKIYHAVESSVIPASRPGIC